MVIAGVSGKNEEGTTVKNSYQAGSSVQVKTPKGGNLNLRSSAGTGDNIITSFKAGTKMEVLEDDGTSDWVKVQVGDQTGYVSRKYISNEE